MSAEGVSIDKYKEDDGLTVRLQALRGTPDLYHGLRFRNAAQVEEARAALKGGAAPTGGRHVMIRALTGTFSAHRIKRVDRALDNDDAAHDARKAPAGGAGAATATGLSGAFHVISIVDVFQLDDALWVVLEDCDDTLASQICALEDFPDARMMEARALVERSARRCGGHVSSAVHWLHTRETPISHRGIRPANVITHGDTYKLSELSTAAHTGSSSTSIMSEGAMDMAWRPPAELCKDVHGVRLGTTQADMWDLGCVVYYAHTAGRHPFDDSVASMSPLATQRSNNLAVYANNLPGGAHGAFRVAYDWAGPDADAAAPMSRFKAEQLEAADFVTRVLRLDSDKVWTAEQLCRTWRHPYLMDDAEKCGMMEAAQQALGAIGPTTSASYAEVKDAADAGDATALAAMAGLQALQAACEQPGCLGGGGSFDPATGNGAWAALFSDIPWRREEGLLPAQMEWGNHVGKCSGFCKETVARVRVSGGSKDVDVTAITDGKSAGKASCLEIEGVYYRVDKAGTVKSSDGTITGMRLLDAVDVDVAAGSEVDVYAQTGALPADADWPKARAFGLLTFIRNNGPGHVHMKRASGLYDADMDVPAYFVGKLPWLPLLVWRLLWLPLVAGVTDPMELCDRTRP